MFCGSFLSFAGANEVKKEEAKESDFDFVNLRITSKIKIIFIIILKKQFLRYRTIIKFNAFVFIYPLQVQMKLIQKKLSFS
jgi:hypothetical protein